MQQKLPVICARRMADRNFCGRLPGSVFGQPHEWCVFSVLCEVAPPIALKGEEHNGALIRNREQ